MSKVPEEQTCGGKHLRLVGAIVVVVGAMLGATNIVGCWQRGDLEKRLMAVELRNAKADETLSHVAKEVAEIKADVKALLKVRPAPVAAGPREQPSGG